MSYTLEQFAADCHEALKANSGQPGREKVLSYVKKAITDQAFVAKHLPDGMEKERNVIYEDGELGFVICAHSYEGAKKGTPHDHGPTWAIYGQAIGETEMTEWKVVEKGEGARPTKVALDKTYHMKPGDAYLYPEGAVHAPMRERSTRLIRIEGQNTEKTTRTNIEAA